MKHNIDFFENAEDLIEWVNDHEEGLELSEKEAEILLQCTFESGCSVGKDDMGFLCVVDSSKGNSVKNICSFSQFVCQISYLNQRAYKNKMNSEEKRNSIRSNQNIIDDIVDRFDTLSGYHLENLTVKDFINILNRFPKNYRIYCCGAESFLYVFPNEESITIDNEKYLCV